MADYTDIINQILSSGSSNEDNLNQYTDFNSAYQSAMRDIARQRAGLSNFQNVSGNRLNQDFSQGLEGLGRGRDESLKSLAEYLSSNGILRSGANIERQGEINQDYGRNVVNLNQGHTRDIEDLISKVTQAGQGLLQREEGLGFQKAQNDAQVALQSAQQQAQALASSQPQYNPDGTYSAPSPALATGGQNGNYSAQSQSQDLSAAAQRRADMQARGNL